MSTKFKKKKNRKEKINKSKTQKKKTLHILQHYLEDEEARKEDHASSKVETF